MMGIGSFLPESGQGVAMTTHPPPKAEVKERVQLYAYSPLGLHGLF
jgi:hypothetical protein